MSKGRRGGGRGTRKRGRKRKEGEPALKCPNPSCGHPLHVGGFCGVRFNIPGDVTHARSGATCGCPPEKCPDPRTPKETV